MIFAGGRFMVTALTGTADPVVIENAVLYLKINISFFFALSVLLVLRNALQGIGRKIVPVLGSVIELAGKFFSAAVIAPLFGYFGICFVEPGICVVCSVLVVYELRRVYRAEFAVSRSGH